MEEEKYSESDVYVREHLLIQFMSLFYCSDNIEIEKVHDDWIEWLNDKEKEHAERSKI